MPRTKKLMPERWVAAIDPGFGTTAVVLLADDIPVEAQCARDKSRQPRHHRIRKMALWLEDLLNEWVVKYEIEELHVVIELAFLNKQKYNKGVTTMASQMVMHGVYLDTLYRVNTRVLVGEVSNNTVKLLFTGHGQADKNMMVAFSAWAKRPDLGLPMEKDSPRQHLADAQAIGNCYPSMTLIDRVKTDVASLPYHVDGAIGKGPKWKGRTV